jgi:ubiquitin-activating enzyme E1
MSDKMAVEKSGDIDESLYSRQLYVLGHEAMKKMASSDVLIVGLGGVGVETAKNVILAGVKSVTLFDPTPSTYVDLSTQFFLTEKHVAAGAPRAAACVASLAELNEYVKVSVLEATELTADLLKNFSVVVFTGSVVPLAQVFALNAAVRSAGVHCIVADTRGVVGYIVNDFGPAFTVSDTNGEPASQNMISAVEKGAVTRVTVTDEARLNLDDGGAKPDEADRITFSEAKGFPQLNELPPQRVKITGPYTLELPDVDSSSWAGEYVPGSGYLHQHKAEKTFTFSPLQEQFVSSPDFLTTDFAKFDSNQLLLLLKAVDAWQAKHDGALPTPGDAGAVADLATTLNEGAKGSGAFVDEVNGDLIRQLAAGAAGAFPPLVAALGGAISQEVLKAVSSKFSPLRGFAIFDAREVLPSAADALAPAKCAVRGDRYDGVRLVLGEDLLAKVRATSVFLVGAGAIGCEVLKNFAMLGIATDGSGKVHVTDMDSIEKSNLSRQFLFRSKDVDKLKADVAAKAAGVMNPQLNVTSYQIRVGPETEDSFNDDFYGGLDLVCNALDNVQARLYMDGQCVYYGLPLLESGTLGAKGNTQVVVPHLTESYGSSRDPPEKSIPTCTLHHFPSTVTHTLQWARDTFEGYFKNLPESIIAYLEKPDCLEAMRKQPGSSKVESIQQLRAAVGADRPRSFADCAVWARLEFEKRFNHQIKQLLHNFPLDMITSTGAKFWSGPKRAPTPIDFSPEDPLHADFVHSGAMLRAFIYGLEAPGNAREVAIEAAVKATVPNFVPKQVKITTDEKDDNPETMTGTDDDSVFDAVVAELPKPSELPGLTVHPIEFEKDDDANFHMDFITSCSNLRATNYSIKLADKHQSKLIAGKIIPAMVTTTAWVSGLVCIELVKLLQRDTKKIEDFKSSFCNLALPFFAFSEPIAAAKTPIREGTEFTLWDRYDLEGPMTLGEFIKYFEDKHELAVSMVSSGTSMIYSFFMGKDKLKDRMDREISEVVAEVSKKPLPTKNAFITFEIMADRVEDDEEVETPIVRYRLPGR